MRRMMRTAAMGIVIGTVFFGSRAPASATCLGDLDEDGQVSIDELVIAVNNALHGCMGPTPTPTREPTRTPTVSLLADLAVVSAVALSCPGGCGPQLIEVCVENVGDEQAPVEDVAINDVVVGEIRSLFWGETDCIAVPYRGMADPDGQARATVNPDGRLPEHDKDNNTLRFPAPNPTACDVVCTPAPVVTPGPA